ncbi:RNA polymerase sigma factor FliA [Candidatus Berkiella cookevillensis]|uniref:RNA polymerase sigma factor FliA n=1 Tax=Candidatus Berkiella cookevillensis TaxID=437022 RepID=A0A0Q9YTB1_9GAMM|nr:RNA polymerase sigma factor FliA [Candidatus Berkiella cookevillensis]MCS5708593.1 RNA polymerase sigma factor FliA [Candidatus Berkiella cookevillensis]
MSGAKAYQLVDNTGSDFVRQHASLVKKIAHHLLARLPQNIQVDDLIQAGMIGLIEAARNYDHTKGAAFTTYAGIRIRGAMLDEIRKEDWAPRSVHKNMKKFAIAIRRIENETGRDAKDADIAKTLNISLEEYHSVIQDMNCAKIFAFDDLGLNDDYLSQPSGQSQIPSPLDGLQQEDFKNKLASEVAHLPNKEKLVLALYYDEELNLREIGEVLGVSESRISQIHSQAMVRLQARLDKWK